MLAMWLHRPPGILILQSAATLIAETASDRPLGNSEDQGRDSWASDTQQRSGEGLGFNELRDCILHRGLGAGLQHCCHRSAYAGAPQLPLIPDRLPHADLPREHLCSNKSGALDACKGVADRDKVCMRMLTHVTVHPVLLQSPCQLDPAAACRHGALCLSLSAAVLHMPRVLGRARVLAGLSIMAFVLQCTVLDRGLSRRAGLSTKF